MIVPFSVADFIDRAVQVYGDRVGVVDEPDQPAPSLGELTYAAARCPRPPAGRDARQARPRGRRPGGDRQPQQRPAAGGVLRRQRLRPGPGAGELPAPARRGALHRRALRRPGAAGRPRARGVAEGRRRPSSSSSSATRRRSTYPRTPYPRPWEPDENATACINYTSGTTARPKGVQITHRNIWVNAVTFAMHARRQRPRRLPAHAADVPRQRLGHAVRDDRARREADRAAQDRRRRDPAPGRATTA